MMECHFLTYKESRNRRFLACFLIYYVLNRVARPLVSLAAVFSLVTQRSFLWSSTV